MKCLIREKNQKRKKKSLFSGLSFLVLGRCVSGHMGTTSGPALHLHRSVDGRSSRRRQLGRCAVHRHNSSLFVMAINLHGVMAIRKASEMALEAYQTIKSCYKRLGFQHLPAAPPFCPACFQTLAYTSMYVLFVSCWARLEVVRRLRRKKKKFVIVGLASNLNAHLSISVEGAVLYLDRMAGQRDSVRGSTGSNYS